MIAFVWYWERASEIYPNWRDGLRAALEEIDKTRHVGWYMDKHIPPEGHYDFILFWGDSECSFFNELDKYNSKKGICLSTMPTNFNNLRKLDVVFCESEPVYQAVRREGIRAIKAFGTDTNFFQPKEVKKDIPYFYPATFSPWKRQSTLSDHGSDLWCVGTLQPDGQGELNAVANAGCHVEVGYFPPEKIRDYYQRAVHVPIPSVHGSERTVLEAMACNILPDVNSENEKAYSYIKEFKSSKFLFPRDFVVNKYSHKKYAEALLKGIYG